jgi:hypothetical protein
MSGRGGMLVRCVVAMAGATVVVTQSNLWVVLGGIVGAALAAMGIERSSRSADASDFRASPGWQALAGLVLVAAGCFVLWRETGQADLVELREVAGSGAVFRPSSHSPETLLSCVLLTVGLLAVGGLGPFAVNERGDASLPADGVRLLARLTALAALVQVVGRSVAIIEPRTVLVLLSLTILGWLTGIISRLGRSAKGSLAELLSLQSHLWLTAVCVVAWESGIPERSLAGQSSIPDGLSALLLCVAGDVGAYLVARLGRGDTLGGPTGSVTPGRVVWRMSVLGLAGSPPLPGFWGRLWVLTALLFAHQVQPTNGLADVHFGLMALATIALLGLWAGVAEALQIVGAGPAWDVELLHAPSRTRRAAAIAGGIVLLIAGLYPRPIVEAVCSRQGRVAEREAPVEEG